MANFQALFGHFALLAAFLCCWGLAGQVAGIRCRAEAGWEQGDPDWFISLKLPKMGSPGRDPFANLIHQGLAHIYFLPDAAKAEWTPSNMSIGDPLSMVGQTLKPLYEGDKVSTPGKPTGGDLMFIMYNDEHPDGNTSSTHGHTKGVVAFDQDEGFWLVHSVPKFPPAPLGGTRYSYPHTGQIYGQSLLCITLKTQESADTVGRQLLYNQPYVYAANVPTWGRKRYPSFLQASLGKNMVPKQPPFFRVETLSSVGKRILGPSKDDTSSPKFTSFAKSSRFGKDLYSDLVAPVLRSSLLVETWPNGRGRMNSSCDRGHTTVENVEEILLRVSGSDFNSTHDHSKWAVSNPHEAPPRDGLQPRSGPPPLYVCIGDINRMESQRARGGGTVCLHDTTGHIWKAFFKSIKDTEACRL